MFKNIRQARQASLVQLPIYPKIKIYAQDSLEPHWQFYWINFSLAHLCIFEWNDSLERVELITLTELEALTQHHEVVLGAVGVGPVLHLLPLKTGGATPSLKNVQTVHEWDSAGARFFNI